MQNSPNSSRKSHRQNLNPKSDTDQYSFTSFTPLSPESTKGSFSLAKFFQWKSSESKAAPKSRGIEAASNAQAGNKAPSKNSPTLSHGRSSPSTKRSKIPRSWSSPRFQRQQGSSLSGSPGQGKQLPQGYRNLSALFKRLSAVADYSKGDQPSQPYKESHFRQYWMPDENCKECYECGEKFNTFRRRHHCRLCGQIFCYRCCNIEIPGELMGYSGGLRVCTYCNKIFQTYTQSPDMLRNLEQLQADIQAVAMDTDYSLLHSTCSSLNTLNIPRTGISFEEDDKFYSQSSLPNSRKTSSGSSTNGVYFEKLEQREGRPSTTMQNVRSPFDAFGVCAAEANMLKQDSLREIWHMIMSKRSGLELQSHRFRLKTYQNCFVATDLVEWLITHEKAMTRVQAVAIGHALLESGWLEPVPQTRDVHDFSDEYALYQPGPVALKDQAAGNHRSSKFYSDSKLKDVSVDENSENENEEDDETAPQWFRQLPGYESGEELDLGESVQADPVSPAGILSVPKHSRASGAKLLDLDVTTAVEEEEGSELNLKVNLDHFCEGNTGGGEGQNTENQGPTLSLTTDVPPPPLEQYVYTEGYPITSLRASYYRKTAETAALATSAEDVLKGAMMARRVGVDRPKLNDPKTLRDDNNERLAMERICKARVIHVSRLVEQLLKDAGLSLEWKDVILPLVEEISEKVAPDVRKDDDMDIRQYVKFKKIPGGRKEDCEVVWGVGFTKNVSNKKMSSSFSNPRILVLCCAIDYQRKENRLASLDPLILQENEFLKNFVARVASLRPNVLLVEKTVSRLAQDMLLQYGITLALNVKPEVIERVARCTKANILRSMEQLSRPQLGTCQQFRVQKYILKNGETKTLMFFDGCPPELGCTVSLRGGNSLVLAKVKKIVQFVTYVSYSQRLETAFLMDEFALPEEPEQFHAGVVSSTTNNAKCSQETTKEDEETDGDLAKEESSDEAGIFQQALGRTVLSSSPYVRYPLPYLLTPEGYRCAVRSRLPKEIYWSARLTNENHANHLTEKELEKFELPNLKRNVNKGVQILEAHPLVWSRVVINSSDQFIQGIVADFRSQGGRIQLKRRNNIESNGRRKSKWLMLDGDGMEKEKRNNAPDGKTRESDNEKKNQKIKPYDVQFNEPATPIHFNRKIDCLDPNYHQRIAVLFSSYSSESNNSPRPCISPWAVFMEFYGRNDITLGGFLERYCFRPSYVCPNPNCDVPMVDHVRYFAHGSGSVYIHMKNLESPIPGFQHTILTWSWCKECKQVTPIVPLSSDAWALSFAKYIELRFYADEYTRRASVEPCDHSLHRLHYQYFAYANMVASFKYRAIKLYETAIPPPSISVKDEVRDATYWVRDVEAISTRGDTVFASILERIDTFKFAKIEFHAPERDSKLAQFTVQLEEDHVRFTEQVQIVEKKVKVLQSLQSPLVESSYDHLDQRDQQALGYVIADSVNGLKRILCEAVDNWNHRLQEFIQVEKKRNNKAGNQRDAKTGDKVENGLSAKSVDDFRDLTEDLNPAQFVSAAPGLSPAFSPWNSRNVSPFVPSEGSDSDLESQVSDVDTSKRDMYFNPIVSADDASKKDDKRGEFEESLTQKENPEGVENNLKNEDSVDENEVSQGNERKNGRMPFVRGHRRIMSYPPQINVTVGGASFEAMDRQTVENLRVIKSGDGLARSFSDTSICIIGKHTEEEDKSLLEISIKSSPSVPVMQKDSPGASDLVKTSKPPVSMSEASTKKNTEQDSPASVDGTPAVRRRDKMKNIISSFLPGSAFQPVASSFPSHEHHLLPPGEKVLVVVSEKEPSSIIAYALSTKEYNTRLCEIQTGLARLTKGTNAIPQESVTDNNRKSPQQFNDSCEEFGDQSTVSSMISLDEGEGDFVNVEIRDLTEMEKESSTEYVEIIEDIQDSVPVRIKRGRTLERQDRVKFSKAIQEKQPEVKGQSVLDDPENIHKNCDEMQVGSDLSSLSEFGFQPDLAGKDQTMEFHIQMQFSYNVCRFYCNAYYAEQFRKLRKHTFTDGEERYIRSLAHCVVWRARGGKSGSSFSKSLDDRFVLKQMSRLELQSFVEFAPHYFQYMNKAIKEKRSTLLAKIFGVYRIGFKNTQTNTTMRQDVLVMENLFYDRKIDKIFDLKGSMRSRYVQVSGREHDVLMDENLLEMIREDPIFIRPHSKAVLSKAIHNDTEFLAHHMVMDYSLLVGIDELRSELVIGIIDFIRTFTWDKKLEMYVKSSGILGGQGKMPTVVSPELYRTRFSEAMQRYFLMVPDKWTGLGNDLD